ncbi:MAG: XRE family transcriptional regulator [Pseudomonadota bacterium]
MADTNRHLDDASDLGLSALGAEVRELRKARRFTLVELATASGVSVSHLSAIERGAVNPSLGKLGQVASALGVPTDWLLASRSGRGPLERCYVVRKDKRRNLNVLYGKSVEEAGYSDALLSSSLGGTFHMGISDYPPYSDAVPDEVFVRDGEQHALVLEGELTLRLEDEVITVRAGDSFSFPGDVLHSTRNLSDRPARLLWANSPVIIPKDVIYDTSKDASRTGPTGQKPDADRTRPANAPGTPKTKPGRRP